MLHVQDSTVREQLLSGAFGLERESLRVTGDGYFAHTPHPFSLDDANIVRDFCENQVEINTGVSDSAEGAIEELLLHTERISRALKEQREPEYLWPFSNPPYIRDEEDIPVAQFTGSSKGKTNYRHYLSSVYGKYKMTLSGIHVNYSFSRELLDADYAVSPEENPAAHRDALYLNLARGLTMYGWLVTALLAASPLMDISYVRKGDIGKDLFLGMASVRCSEMGYWNHFVPIFSYQSIREYVASIRKMINEKMIVSQTELYVPIRLKPRGENNLETLLERGVNHIELRNVDVNPFVSGGLDVRDLSFIQYLIVYLASMPQEELSPALQIRSFQNFKSAAHYDIDAANILLPDGTCRSVRRTALWVLDRMEEFYNDLGIQADEILDYQKQKMTDEDSRYAVRVMKQFSGDYVKKGLREV